MNDLSVCGLCALIATLEKADVLEEFDWEMAGAHMIIGHGYQK